MISSVVFVSIFIFSISIFARNCKRIYRNISLGKKIPNVDKKKERIKKTLLIAFGQSKMFDRPVVGFLHLIVYVAFLLINIELLEIIIDGVSGKHRSLAPYLGSFYNFLIAFFEILALSVIISVILFWIRRNIIRIERFIKNDLKGWPKLDANMILYIEIILMFLFLNMNATDQILQNENFNNYLEYGSFPVSSYMTFLYSDLSVETVFYIERASWWLHIIGILFFLNYLYYSKHLHIILAFPNVYYSNLEIKGKLSNMKSVLNEVKLMLNIDPEVNSANSEIERLGAKDVFDLNQFQLLSAYTCTECGRCSSECPANITGKLLSPRSIMMKTRDRLEEVGININKNKQFLDDNKSLLGDYIKKEEIWACTTCNACVESCPIGIDPMSIILDIRRYMVMEESSAPNEINNMMTNIENNGAPWQFNNQDRINWIKNN